MENPEKLTALGTTGQSTKKNKTKHTTQKTKND